MKNSPVKFRSPLMLSLFCMTAAFVTYCSMYAFRKPFTAAAFDGMTLWGIDYKIVLIVAQVLGYMLSKFLGIKLVSEMTPTRRIAAILVLMGISWGSLLLFGLTPKPYNIVWMFFNGLPLGMIWGIVFSFLEGRRSTELLGAGMSASFIVASGLVKSAGRHLMDAYHISEFWMPFVTGLLFVPALLAGVWMLSKIPPPDAADQVQRTERVPMTGAERRAFFLEFAPGIILVVLIFMALTIFRDLRDNFAVEIWTQLGYADTSRVLLLAEIPIAIAVFVIVALMIYIKSNRSAFFANIGIIILGGLLLMISTYSWQRGLMPSSVWMILIGFAMYLAYISYHTMLFERWIALFRYRSNIGFLMYMADSFGYLGSVGVLLYKNFSRNEADWPTFIAQTSYLTGIITILLGVLAGMYFWGKSHVERQAAPALSVVAEK